MMACALVDMPEKEKIDAVSALIDQIDFKLIKQRTFVRAHLSVLTISSKLAVNISQTCSC